MLVFNNTIKSPLKNIEIKGNTTPCGFDNGDGTFKITILTTNGLEKSDPKYEEVSQDIIIPCKLGSVNEKQDIIRFDKTRNKLILEQKTENGKLLEKPKIHELNFTLNVIGFDGKSTIKVFDGSVEAIVKATASKTLFSGQHAIADTLREIMSAISSNFNYINKVKAALDSHRHKNVTTTSDGFMSKEDKEKLNGVQINANNYIHPNDVNTRHVSDAQIASWDEKPTNMDVDKKIKKVVGSAPEALDTLKEISDALNNDSDFAGTMTKQLANKSDKEHNHDNNYVPRTPKRIRNGDLNSIVQGGNYVAENCTNSPNSYGRLVVLQWDTSAKWITQIFYSDMRNEVFTRCSLDSQGNTWSEWRKLSTNVDNDLRYFRTNNGQVSDFNQCLTDGKYNVSSETPLPNSPIAQGIYGELLVFTKNANELHQIYLDYRCRTFIRFKSNNSGWSSWVESYSPLNKPSASDIGAAKNQLTNNAIFYNEPIAVFNETKTQCTGVLKILLPKSWTSTMISFDLINYDYSDLGKSIYHISGYNWTGEGGSWCGTQYAITGKTKSATVRFGYDTISNKCCILVGKINTVWSYPKFVINNLLTGHSDYVNWNTDWSMSIIQSETGIEKIVSGNYTSSYDNIYARIDRGWVKDFNNCLDSGVYNVSGTDVSNAPFGGNIYGTLEVLDRNGDKIQRVTTSSGAIFIRYYAGGGANQGFREWIKVYTSTTAPKWSEIREKPSTLEGLSVGDDSITVMPHRSNEISFGGAFRGNSTIYFGYRDIEGRPAPTEYVFGKAGSGADIKAKDFYAMGNKVYHPGNKPTWNDIENKPDLDSKYFLNYRDSVTDFNNCKAPGNYYVSKTNIPNAPYDQGGFIQGILLVYKSFNNIIQIFIDSFNNINTRFYDSANSSWGIWERSAALKDFTSMFDSKSGYQKLPNGTIIQWGSKEIPFDSGNRAHGYLNYPIAFKEYAHVTGNVASNDYGGFCETSGIVANDTLSRAYAEATDISNRNQKGHSVKFQWIAIGR